MKRFFAVMLSAVCLLVGVFFVGCEGKGPIPNGHYGPMNSIPEEPLPDLYFGFTKGDIRDSYGWVIDGDTAEAWVSGSCYYKAKIVEREDGIYFEGYKWRDLLDILFRDGKRSGNTDVYQVVYDEGKRSIALALVVVPVEDKQ